MADGKSYQVVQLGARMHYAVPRILHNSGRLDCFYTDFWYPNFRKKIPAFSFLQKLIRNQNLIGAMESRFHPELEKATVLSCDFFGIRYRNALAVARNRADQTRAFINMGKTITQWVIRKSQKTPEAMYVFNSAALEIMESPLFADTFMVLEQTLAPRKTERLILQSEYTKRNLPIPVDPFSETYERREKDEWDRADKILCASEFVRQSLLKWGVSPSKIALVPYGVDLPGHKPEFEREKNRPLHILFAGNGGIRKGLPYLIEAVSTLGGHTHLHIAGDHELPPRLVKKSSHITWHGKVPRMKMQELYSKCNVFALPSLCEGSATVIYEAMAHGLAIICTENCGAVVKNGQEGIIVPISEVYPVREAIQEFLDAPDFLTNCRKNAFETAKKHTSQKYGHRLLSEL